VCELVKRVEAAGREQHHPTRRLWADRQVEVRLIVRPSLTFGEDDHFFSRFAASLIGTHPIHVLLAAGAIPRLTWRAVRVNDPNPNYLDELFIRSVNYRTPLDRFLNDAADRRRMGRPSGKCRLFGYLEPNVSGCCGSARHGRSLRDRRPSCRRGIPQHWGAR
jgi:hypothetical protein